MKVQDLNGAELDYWVWQADSGVTRPDPQWFDAWHRQNNDRRDYSVNWAQGGPIIERERININERDGDCWGAFYSGGWTQFGPTPLIAACRAYVASKFGPEVPDVPDVEG